MKEEKSERNEGREEEHKRRKSEEPYCFCGVCNVNEQRNEKRERVVATRKGREDKCGHVQM